MLCVLPNILIVDNRQCHGRRAGVVGWDGSGRGAQGSARLPLAVWMAPSAATHSCAAAEAGRLGSRGADRMLIARKDSGRWTAASRKEESVKASGGASATAGCGRDERGLARNPPGACGCGGHDNDVVKVRGTIIADLGRGRAVEAVAMVSICVRGPAAAECGRGRAAVSAGS